MSKAMPHADHVRHASQARDDICAPLALSWQRCVNLHRLDPEIAPPMNRLSEPELRDMIAPMERLLAIAAPSLERLHRSIGLKGTCLLVSNADGIPVYSSGCASHWASWPGCCPGTFRFS